MGRKKQNIASSRAIGIPVQGLFAHFYSLDLSEKTRFIENSLEKKEGRWAIKNRTTWRSCARGRAGGVRGMEFLPILVGPKGRCKKFGA